MENRQTKILSFQEMRPLLSSLVRAAPFLASCNLTFYLVFLFLPQGYSFPQQVCVKPLLDKTLTHIIKLLENYPPNISAITLVCSNSLQALLCFNC